MPVLVAAILPVAGIVSRPAYPVTFAFEKIVANWRAGLLVSIAFAFFMSAFTTFKIRLVPAFGFYADPVLAELDKWIFGVDPWLFVRQFSPGFVISAIPRCYGTIWFVTFVGTVAYVAFFRPARERTRYLTALVASWVFIGTILAAAFSSAGPLFFDRVHGTNRFSGLLAALDQSDKGSNFLKYSDYLYNSYVTGHPSLGTGISAFPSIHVTVAVLNAVYFTSISRVFGTVMWFYAGMIFAGSMYTGFHYAVDGMVSAMIVPLIWVAAGRFASGPPGARTGETAAGQRAIGIEQARNAARSEQVAGNAGTAGIGSR